MKDQLSQLLRAGYAGLYLRTPEEQRVEALLLSVVKERNRSLWVWSCTEGLRKIHPQQQQTEPSADSGDIMTMLANIANSKDFKDAVVILRDFHEFLQSPEVKRSFRDAVAKCRSKKVSLVIVAARLVLPPEIEKEVTLLDFALPTKSELSEVLDFVANQAKVGAPTDREIVLEAARGLTTIEAQDVFALSLVAKSKQFNASFIAARKAEAVKRTGLLEFYEPAYTLADVGGLGNVKGWLNKRRRAFTPEAREFGLPEPKGLLLLGIPGSGKSLTAKAASAAWGKPLLRLDVGRLFGSLVGESEANLRSALTTAEAVSPCILWLDELEKAFGQGGSLDGGTSLRVFGSFLTWMQEKKQPVFVFATANDVSKIPAELLRKGRFDEIFFVDLPSQQEREAIWKIHVAKRNRDVANFNITKLAEATKGWVGAEIEQAVVDALFEAFDQNRELEQGDLEAAIGRTLPLSQTMRERIGALREWAKGRAVLASITESDAMPEVQSARAIELDS